MRFSHLIKFNSVPDWRDYYIDYSAIKKIIYAISKREADELQQEGPRNERNLQARHSIEIDSDDDQGVTQPLLTPREQGKKSKEHDTDEELLAAMQTELARINQFYIGKEADFNQRLIKVEFEMTTVERQLPVPVKVSSWMWLAGGSPDAVGGSPDAQSVASGEGGQADVMSLIESLDAPDGHTSSSLLNTRHVPGNREERIKKWSGVIRGFKSFGIKPSAVLTPEALKAVTKKMNQLKAKLKEIYIFYDDLFNFIETNKEGFRKAMKKYGKVCSGKGKVHEIFWPTFEESYHLAERKSILEQAKACVVDHYSILFFDGNLTKAKYDLERHKRQQIEVERNTVWKDMVAIERMRGNAAVKDGMALDSTGPWGWVVSHKNPISFILSLGVFAILLSIDAPFPDAPEKQNCLALLCFLSMLWASEAIPLYVTSIMVSPLVVLLKVMMDKTKEPPERMSAPDSAHVIFQAMFSSTIMLLLGGFSIASALSKHFIAKQLAIQVMSRVGNQPRNVLLAAMCVAAFASMFISNVAAPVLTFTIVQPILRNLDTKNSFAKALVMGIALASNVGGMTSPISSPQNIFAIERMSMDGKPPSWLLWFAVSLPVSGLCILICWGLIMMVYRPWLQLKEVTPIKANLDPLNATQVYVIVVSVLTVALWCANTQLQEFTGAMGIVATLPLIAFFGAKVLSKDDFNGFLWNVVMLAMGGSALGEAIKSSGLLFSIASSIQDLTEGFDLYQVLVVFCLLVLICTTFISHTVGAMVILPIVQSVGEQMPGSPHPKLLVFAAALMCSGAMGLPISGFPNMNAVSLEDATGQTYVGVVDFLKVGLLSSFLAYLVIISVGYYLMLLVRF